jgi:hypothetical protein
MSGPALVIAAGSVTMVFAFSGRDALVADDYYRQGIGINRTLEREAQARALGLRGTLVLDPGAVRVVLESAKPLPERIRLTASSATRAGIDRVLTLTRDAGGTYWAPMAPLADGRWRFILETDSWRVVSRVRDGDASRVELRAER